MLSNLMKKSEKLLPYRTKELKRLLWRSFLHSLMSTIRTWTKQVSWNFIEYFIKGPMKKKSEKKRKEKKGNLKVSFKNSHTINIQRSQTKLMSTTYTVLVLFFFFFTFIIFSSVDNFILILFSSSSKVGFPFEVPLHFLSLEETLFVYYYFKSFSQIIIFFLYSVSSVFMLFLSFYD